MNQTWDADGHFVFSIPTAFTLTDACEEILSRSANASVALKIKVQDAEVTVRELLPRDYFIR